MKKFLIIVKYFSIINEIIDENLYIVGKISKSDNKQLSNTMKMLDWLIVLESS